MDNQHATAGEENTILDAKPYFLAALGDDAFWDYAHELASAAQPTSDRQDEYLLCRIGEQYGLLALSFLREVYPTTASYAFLPSTPSWMIGLTAWRGTVVPVIDLAAYMGKESQVSWVLPRTAHMLFIAHYHATLLAFSVASAETSIALEPQRMHATHRTQNHIASERLDMLQGIYVCDEIEAWVFDMAKIFTDIVQQIEITIT